jgi:hypothetical protein
MKKYMILCTLMIMAVFAGCSSQSTNCGERADGESWAEDCNTCSCIDGEIICTEIACEIELEDEIENSTTADKVRDELFALKFNANLTDYESEWLTYLEVQNPNTRIIHIKSDVYSCDGCYDLYFKKDREIVKIKVLDGDLRQESVITDDVVPLIENADVCAAFGGEWNDCPSPCSTDEEACITMCNPAICEFDENAIVLKQDGEECGGLDKGDCAFGLTCYYSDKDDVYGVCQKK